MLTRDVGGRADTGEVADAIVPALVAAASLYVVGMRIADARELWTPAGVYCNTASYGLPPRPAWDALQAALADWQGGRTSWEPWGESTEASRAAFARLVGVDATRVAVGATVSELVGSVITALPAGARVVVPDIEFTSQLFPLLVQSRLDVRTVPVAQVAGAVADGADAVAFSAVQMSTGEVADVDAILDAAADVDAVTICDATQASAGCPSTRPFRRARVQAYKWLMSPRGTAFVSVSSACSTTCPPQRRLVLRRGRPLQLLRPAAAAGA